jgi:hypothetical protein
MIYYNSYDIFNNKLNEKKLEDVPGGTAFSSYFQIFSNNISCSDRTDIMKTPMDVKLLPNMKMPTSNGLNDKILGTNCCASKK